MIIAQADNYGQIYACNITKPFNLARDVNDLIKNGGIIGSLTFR